MYFLYQGISLCLYTRIFFFLYPASFSSSFSSAQTVMWGVGVGVGGMEGGEPRSFSVYFHMISFLYVFFTSGYFCFSASAYSYIRVFVYFLHQGISVCISYIRVFLCVFPTSGYFSEYFLHEGISLVYFLLQGISLKISYIRVFLCVFPTSGYFSVCFLH